MVQSFSGVDLGGVDLSFNNIEGDGPYSHLVLDVHLHSEDMRFDARACVETHAELKTALEATASEHGLDVIETEVVVTQQKQFFEQSRAVPGRKPS